MFRLVAVRPEGPSAAPTQLGPVLDRCAYCEAPSASRGAHVPQINFNPTNQCTLDDPTDGADLPTLAPNSAAPSGAPSTASEPSCQAPDHSNGGAANDECTDALVRRFSAEGAGPTESEARGGPWCPLELFATALSCGKVLAEIVGRQPVPASDAANCAANLNSLVHCKTD